MKRTRPPKYIDYVSSNQAIQILKINYRKFHTIVELLELEPVELTMGKYEYKLWNWKQILQIQKYLKEGLDVE